MSYTEKIKQINDKVSKKRIEQLRIGLAPLQEEVNNLPKIKETRREKKLKKQIIEDRKNLIQQRFTGIKIGNPHTSERKLTFEMKPLSNMPAYKSTDTATTEPTVASLVDKRLRTRTVPKGKEAKAIASSSLGVLVPSGVGGRWGGPSERTEGQCSDDKFPRRAAIAVATKQIENNIFYGTLLKEIEILSAVVDKSPFNSDTWFSPDIFSWNWFCIIFRESKIKPDLKGKLNNLINYAVNYLSVDDAKKLALLNEKMIKVYHFEKKSALYKTLISQRTKMIKNIFSTKELTDKLKAHFEALDKSLNSQEIPNSNIIEFKII